MISQYLQSLSAPTARVHGHAVRPGLLITGNAANPLANILRRLLAVLSEIDRKRRVAYENRRAIAHLEALSDAQLRDIGIYRHEIEHSVRDGR